MQMFEGISPCVVYEMTLATRSVSWASSPSRAAGQRWVQESSGAQACGGDCRSGIHNYQCLRRKTQPGSSAHAAWRGMVRLLRRARGAASLTDGCLWGPPHALPLIGTAGPCHHLRTTTAATLSDESHPPICLPLHAGECRERPVKIQGLDPVSPPQSQCWAPRSARPRVAGCRFQRPNARRVRVLGGVALVAGFG